MGYSAKYHALSLMAVFVALAIGILIGVGFGDSLVEGGADQLQKSLSQDLQDTQQALAFVEGQLESERQYSAETFPAIVENKLRDQQITVVAFGGRPGDVRDDLTAALEPSGAVVNELVVFPDTIDRADVADALSIDPDALASDDNFGMVVRRVARGMVRGADVYREARRSLASESSGAPGQTDGVIFVIEPAAEDNSAVATDSTLFQENLVAGFEDDGIPMVGVRRTDGDPAATDTYIEWGISSVDNINEVPGRVSLVYVLRGRNGTFGTSETASALIPDLLGVPPLEPEESISVTKDPPTVDDEPTE